MFWTKTGHLRSCRPKRRRKKKKTEHSGLGVFSFLFVGWFVFLAFQGELWIETHTAKLDCQCAEQTKRQALSPAVIHPSEWAFTVSSSPTRVVLFLKGFSFCFSVSERIFSKEICSIVHKAFRFSYRWKVFYLHISMISSQWLVGSVNEWK